MYQRPAAAVVVTPSLDGSAKRLEHGEPAFGDATKLRSPTLGKGLGHHRP